MDSIIQKQKVCFMCGSRYNLHKHHIFFGPNRTNSEKAGLTVYLCQGDHEGPCGVHGKYGHELDQELKRIAQAEFEKTHTREDFVSLIGRSYL